MAGAANFVGQTIADSYGPGGFEPLALLSPQLRQDWHDMRQNKISALEEQAHRIRDKRVADALGQVSSVAKGGADSTDLSQQEGARRAARAAGERLGVPEKELRARIFKEGLRPDQIRERAQATEQATAAVGKEGVDPAILGGITARPKVEEVFTDVAKGQAARKKEKDVFAANSAVDQSKQIAVHLANSREDLRRTRAMEADDQLRADNKAKESRAMLNSLLATPGGIPDEQKNAVEMALTSLPETSSENTAVLHSVLQGTLRRVPETKLRGKIPQATQGQLIADARQLAVAESLLKEADSELRDNQGNLDPNLFSLYTDIGEKTESVMSRLNIDTYSEEYAKYRRAQDKIDLAKQSYAKGESGLNMTEQQFSRLSNYGPVLNQGMGRYQQKMDVFATMNTRKLNLSLRLAKGDITLEEAIAEFRDQTDEGIEQMKHIDESADDDELIKHAQELGVDVPAVLQGAQ